MLEASVEVLVVGAGPTGLAVANLLAARGIEVLVVEREVEVAPEPRAVSIDDESMRLLQSLGLPAGPTTAVVPGSGTHYFGRHGQFLAGAKAELPHPLGHPVKNPIDHTDFTRLLLTSLGARDAAVTRFQAEVSGLEADAAGAVASLATESGEERVAARYVLGCDGGRSTVRKLLGIEMNGGSLDEPWLVIDTVADPHDQRYAMHHGDPRRPHVILPGPDGRCRYEFLLHEDEEIDEVASFSYAQRLLEPLRGPLAPVHVRRQQVYVFHSLVAERWRAGSAFLLGDAAHMMPPFAGQGLSTGLRDAANLGWKLAAVLRGELGEAVLDSYESERRPHAEAMVELSVNRGRMVMTQSRAKALARDLAVKLARRSRPLRRRLEAMPLKPPPRFRDGFIVRRDRDPAIVGAMLPQPRVLAPDGSCFLLDQALGNSFALLEVDPAPGPDLSLDSPLWTRIGARRVRLLLDERYPPTPPTGGATTVADLDGLLVEALADCHGLVLVVRPDRFVMGAFEPGEEERFVAAWEASDRDLLVLSPEGEPG